MTLPVTAPAVIEAYSGRGLCGIAAASIQSACLDEPPAQPLARNVAGYAPGMPFPPALQITAAAFRARGMAVSELRAEAESLEYGAHTLAVNGQAAAFRIARTTPKKAGQFVTLWQRTTPEGGGPIRPFDTSDGVELFIVSVSGREGSGHFVFPQATLIARGIVSRDFAGGKRAMRVYPPWSAPTNRTAQATQRWQAEFYCPGNPPGFPTVNSMHGRISPSLGEGRNEQAD